MDDPSKLKSCHFGPPRALSAASQDGGPDPRFAAPPPKIWSAQEQGKPFLLAQMIKKYAAADLADFSNAAMRLRTRLSGSSGTPNCNFVI